MLDGCDYALAIPIVILNFSLTGSAPRTAADRSIQTRKAHAKKNGGVWL